MATRGAIPAFFLLLRYLLCLIFGAVLPLNLNTAVYKKIKNPIGYRGRYLIRLFSDASLTTQRFDKM